MCRRYTSGVQGISTGCCRYASGVTEISVVYRQYTQCKRSVCEAVQQQSSVDPVEVISSVNEIQVKIHTQEKIQDQDTFQEERRSSWNLLVVVRVGLVRNSIPHTHTIQLSIVVCCQGECVIQAGQVVWVQYRTVETTFSLHRYICFYLCETYPRFTVRTINQKIVQQWTAASLLARPGPTL